MSYKSDPLVTIIYVYIVADFEEGAAPTPFAPNIYHLMFVKLKI
jgi:hypothetical protein